MYVISKILCKRLGKVSDISYELADGDLTLKLEEDSKDEIGEMNKNLNVFIEKLKNMVTEIKDESKNIIENSDYNENRIAKWVGKYN